MAKLETEDFIVEYNDDEVTRDMVFDRVLYFFARHESFSGECIMQSDAPQIHAAEFLSDLADDVFQFKTEIKEEY